MSKSISVATDAQNAKSLRLSMRFTVETIITMTPRPQIYTNALVGQPSEGRILMHRNDGKKLEISAVRYESSPIEVVALPVDLKGEIPPGLKPVAGDVWLVAKAKEGTAPGNYSLKVWLTTNHPKLTEVVIPVTFRIKPVISSHPEQVRLWFQPEGAGARGTLFRINHNGSANFEITGITTADDSIVTASQVGEGPARTHSIRVEASPELDGADLGKTGLSTEVVISTSDPKQPEVRVPVLVVERQAVTRPGRRPAELRPSDIQRMGGATKKIVPNPLPTGTPKVGKK